jgi:mRNA interferase HigB
MRIFNRSAVEHYGRQHAVAREALRAWYMDAVQAQWQSPDELKRQFPKASVIANNRIVFNIAGNAFRLIVSFNYKFQAGYIKFFGTHAEYDRIDAATVDHTGVHHGKAKR